MAKVKNFSGAVKGSSASKSVEKRMAVQTPAVAEAATSGSAAVSDVVSSENSEPVAAVAPAVSTPVAGGTKKMITLNRSTKDRKSKSLIFVSPELRGTVRFPASAFTTVPESITLEAEGLAPKTGGKPKLSKEERAAARAAQTPADRAKAAQERADRAVKRAQKLAEEAAKAANENVPQTTV